MYPVLKIMHMLNFLHTFSVGVTEYIRIDITKNVNGESAKKTHNTQVNSIQQQNVYKQYVQI